MRVGLRSTGRDTLWKLAEVAITASWISANFLLGAATLDADGVAQLLVARRHGGIESEEATEIDLTVGLDLQAFEGDPAHRALRHVSHRHAGVERRQQMTRSSMVAGCSLER